MKVFIAYIFLAQLAHSLLVRPQHTLSKVADRGLAVKTADGKPVDPRKLFLSFYWNSKEKRYTQRERMKEVMKNAVKNVMERYQFEAHLDQWNHETLEDIHRQYTKTKSNIQLAKHFLLEKMDNIYNNFVQPARWFY